MGQVVALGLCKSLMIGSAAGLAIRLNEDRLERWRRKREALNRSSQNEMIESCDQHRKHVEERLEHLKKTRSICPTIVSAGASSQAAATEITTRANQIRTQARQMKEEHGARQAKVTQFSNNVERIGDCLEETEQRIGCLDKQMDEDMLTAEVLCDVFQTTL